MVAAALLLAACDKPIAPGDTGSLTVRISGLPAQSPAVVTLNGPSLNSTIASTTTFHALTPGTYTVGAPNVQGATPRYPTALTQTIEVVAGETQTANVRYGTLPVSGNHVPQLDLFDSAMVAFMNARSIRSGVMAISIGGTIRYSRGFGWKDAGATQPLPADAMFRLASVSKPVTAAAIRKLAGTGAFSLTTRAFEYLGLTPAGSVVDSRIYDITIAQLLDHSAGWDRSVAGDLVFLSRTISNNLGISTPPTKTQVAQWVMTQPLQFTPGIRTAYSNLGYSVLGLIVEKASGMPYIDYVKQNIFSPSAAASVVGGRTLVPDRDSREPFYTDPATGCSVFAVSVCVLVPQPEGAWYLEAFDSFGGIVASAPAIASFLGTYWISGHPRVSGGQYWYFFGSLPGTFTLASQRLDGIDMVVLFNQRTDPSGLAYDAIYDDMNAVAARVSWIF